MLFLFLFLFFFFFNFRLGLILVEMASNNYLPDTGVYWQDLRKGNISLCENLDHASPELLDLIKRMIDPNPKSRPTATEIIKIAEEQLERFSEDDLTEPLPCELMYDEFAELPSSSSSITYTLSSSSSFIENDVDIIEDDTSINEIDFTTTTTTPAIDTIPSDTTNSQNKKIVNEREEEDDDFEKDKYLFKNKTKRKKKLSLNDFIVSKETKSSVSKSSKAKKLAKETTAKRKTRKSKVSEKENTAIPSSNINTKTVSQQTLISDHFIRKKNDKTATTDTNTDALVTPLAKSPTSIPTINIINPSPNTHSNTTTLNNTNTNSFLNTSENQEVSLYYKQEKLSERRKTLDHIPKKDNKKVVILDIGKGISKMKGNNKKRVKWKEWNKIIEIKDDTLTKEILFCNED